MSMLEWDEDELTTQPLLKPGERMEDIVYSEEDEARAEALALARDRERFARIDAANLARELLPNEPSWKRKQREEREQIAWYRMEIEERDRLIASLQATIKHMRGES